MKDLDLSVLVSVFLEMMGPLFWLLLLLGIAGIVGFVAVFLREGKLDSRRLIRSELVGLAGGVAALVLMASVTVSGFTDAGGPVDWLLIGIIWGIGLAGTTILAYAVQGLLAGKRPTA
ncbi:DUF5368 domain-containing protein [Caenispirillum bisanense]|uniref:Uncharacterized protein n=1 Tax=Caenispirillum bisanense TaxID=414052 RepID=A0A286G726_9PROT|nr:DUF5368 domain-containing protein [Caenispirillum bisanense]SOD90929.1 hypothetical protein SAMN05421508_101723 [Caenispirillum bisanense]